MYAAILAGGTGTRLWPCSRQSHPKQFTDITGSGSTMIQEAVHRIQGLFEPHEIYVITGQRYVQLAATQLPKIPLQNIITEPSGRNTAPAIGLVCVHLMNRDPEAIVAVLPADHVIRDAARFQTALRQAEAAAKAGYLVTLGIEPTSPHTGYGYIKRTHQLDMDEELPVYAVEGFLEKPDLVTAQQFLASGHYYWNGGIFISRADQLLAEIDRQLPALSVALQKIGQALGTGQAEQVLLEAWEAIPNISIDYGIMEHAHRVAMVPLQAGWNDVGSWDALAHVLQPDVDGNYQTKHGALLVDSRNNIIYNDKRQVVLLGVEEIVVVDTGDVLLIGDRKEMQKVKDVVEQLRAQGRHELL